jgi:hypothetical protein
VSCLKNICLFRAKRRVLCCPLGSVIALSFMFGAMINLKLILWIRQDLRFIFLKTYPVVAESFVNIDFSFPLNCHHYWKSIDHICVGMFLKSQLSFNYYLYLLSLIPHLNVRGRGYLGLLFLYSPFNTVLCILHLYCPIW